MVRYVFDRRVGALYNTLAQDKPVNKTVTLVSRN